MSAPRFTFPVITSPACYPCETVAEFFAYGDAASFAMERNLYMAPPRYDRRAYGYRPAEKSSGYKSWCAEMDTRLTEVRGDPFGERFAA